MPFPQMRLTYAEPDPDGIRCLVERWGDRWMPSKYCGKARYPQTAYEDMIF
jgi:hypothetical protein